MANNVRLAARVAAINRANRVAMELYPLLVAVFAPLVGTQVKKQDGDLTARVKKLLPTFPDGPNIMVYRLSSDYSLGFVVKTNEPDGPFSCLYHETVVYVGNCRNGVLQNITAAPEHRCDYTAEEVLEKRAAYEAAQKIASALKSALYPFDEYDR